MPENGIRSTYTQCPFQILLCDDEGIISTGSAFFYEVNGEWFLITNWHNFSGKHFLTNEPLGRTGRFPTFIKAKLSSYVPSVPGQAERHFTLLPRRIEIYQDHAPLWYQHPELGSSCDLVALPMNRPPNCPEFMHNAANRISNTRIPVKPGCTAFVIGFPRSLSVGFGLPLWKAGYIASEPHFDVTIGGDVSEFAGLRGGIQVPAFFIDSETREGMSGSPVFAAFTGNWDMTDPYRALDLDDPGFWQRNDVALGENGMEFIGCYSGRVGRQEEGAALGLCWREGVIREICERRALASHPHVTIVDEG